MGLDAVALSLGDVLDFVADEIAQLRKTGRSDDDIAALITAAIGRDVPAGALAPRDETPKTKPRRR